MATTVNPAETAGVEAEKQAAGHHPHEVMVIVHIHDDDYRGTQEFKVSRHATLLHMMAEATRLAGLSLLPPEGRPFDKLYRGDDTSTGAIEDLDEPVGECIREAVGHPHFLIELARAFRVNNRWAVAPARDMTPRAILALPEINLDYQEFTLYPPDSDDPLPLDTPVCVKRGTDFEAQRDGKYGKGPA
jgi:hypothetical protein